jgi:hypothetical protein
VHTLKSPVTSSTPLVLSEARVAMVLDDAHCLLANGREASRALSCLVELSPGDVVLCAQSEGACHVLHVLAREASSVPVAISVPNGAEISLRGRSVSIHALENIELMSARDASVTAATGTLSLNARNLFATVSESLVQQSRYFIGKAGQYLLDVRHLLKLHGQDALITAERDIKADAERISMG